MHDLGKTRLPLWLLLFFLALLPGCSSVKKGAVNAMAGALSGGGEGGTNVFTSEDDPDLIKEALPFALKTFEALLQEVPENTDLLLTTCQGYALYAYANADLEAERLFGSTAPGSYRQARFQQERALKFYLRARDYCFRALDTVYPGLSQELTRDPGEALAKVELEHLPLLYWTAGTWGSAVSQGVDRPELVVHLPSVRALLGRSLELDEDYGDGALHEAMILLEALPETMGGSLERAQFHYERALELNGGKQAGIYVTWARTVAVNEQDRDLFVELLEKALALDLEGVAENDRLVHVMQQRLAKILLDRIDEFFLPPLDEEEGWEEDPQPEDGGTP